MGFAVDRNKMVLAMAVKGNVLFNQHLIVFVFVFE